jgi:hypothetical protein
MRYLLVRASIADQRFQLPGKRWNKYSQAQQKKTGKYLPFTLTPQCTFIEQAQVLSSAECKPRKRLTTQEGHMEGGRREARLRLLFFVYEYGCRQSGF